MSRRTLYLIVSIVLLVFAFGFLVVPEWFMGFYGATLGLHAVWISRFLGSVQLANSYFLWQMKDADRSSKGAKTFSQGSVAAWGLVAIFVAIGAINGDYNAMAWGQVVLSAVLTVLFALDGFR
jgi:hypothetical protein